MIEIQERITITQKEVDKVIEDYKKMPKRYWVSFGEFSGNKNDIIKEIKKLSEVGKKILLMRYNFNKWMKGGEEK